MGQCLPFVGQASGVRGDMTLYAWDDVISMCRARNGACRRECERDGLRDGTGEDKERSEDEYIANFGEIALRQEPHTLPGGLG